jgi:hypothetical protein
MSSANPVIHYWRGDGPLWRVYWLWGVLGSLVLAGAFGWGVVTYGVTWGYVLIAALVMGAYTTWILVSVWRCAPNARQEHWGQAARMLTAAWALNVILVGAFLAIDLLR